MEAKNAFDAVGFATTTQELKVSVKKLVAMIPNKDK